MTNTLTLSKMNTRILFSSMALAWADTVWLSAYRGQLEAAIIAPCAIAAVAVALASLGRAAK